MDMELPFGFPGGALHGPPFEGRGERGKKRSPGGSGEVMSSVRRSGPQKGLRPKKEFSPAGGARPWCSSQNPPTISGFFLGSKFFGSEGMGGGKRGGNARGGEAPRVPLAGEVGVHQAPLSLKFIKKFVPKKLFNLT